MRGELVEEQARKILSGILERAGEGSIRVQSAESYMRDWLSSKTALKSPATAERYRGVVEGFLESLGDRAERPITAVTPRQVETFLNARLKAGCSTTTVNLDGKILRTVFNAARRRRLILTNPAEAVDLPEKASVERGTFSPIEVRMLVDAAEGEWKTLILLGYYTGARLSDCCRMEWEDIDLAAGALSQPRRIGTSLDLATTIADYELAPGARAFAHSAWERRSACAWIQITLPI